jgi:hypothetical protein
MKLSQAAVLMNDIRIIQHEKSVTMASCTRANLGAARLTMKDASEKQEEEKTRPKS